MWGRGRTQGVVYGQEADEDGREGGSAKESTTCAYVCAIPMHRWWLELGQRSLGTPVRTTSPVRALGHACILFSVLQRASSSPAGKLRRQHNTMQHTKQAQHHANTPGARHIKHDAKPRQASPGNTIPSAARTDMEFLTRGHCGVVGA